MFMQVEIYNPQVGKTYTVKVNPKQIVTPHPSTGGQPYALVVTGSFEKDANLYPSAAPQVTTSSSQIVLGERNRFTVQGQNFAASGNTAKLTCGTTEIPDVVVTSSAQTLITIEIRSSSWTCPGGSVDGVITAGGGFSSAPVQIAVAVAASAITGGGTVVIGADGFAQVVPASASARDDTCLGFIDEESCSKIEFCLWDSTTRICNAQPLISPVVLILIILVIIFIIGGLYVFFIGCCGVGGRKAAGGGQKYQQKEKPVVAMTATPGLPPPPPNKPKTQQRPLQPGWVEAIDHASGDVYYFNQSTGATTWERHLIEA